MIAVLAFWLCLGSLFYAYLGYPLGCWLLSKVLYRRPLVCDSGPRELPYVSIVTSAFNESPLIRASIENKLSLQYPADRLEMLVVSDASTDGTDEIVAAFSNRGVRLFRQVPRMGKTAGLNLAVSRARGVIVAFADANSMWAPEALLELVAPFMDSTVGYVTGQMQYRSPDGSLSGAGCSAYMKWENLIRSWENKIGSIVGVDGGIDAVRRELYEPMRPDQLPDLILPLSVREKGYRIVYAPNALLHEDALASSADEFRMRVRVCLRAWHALKDKHQMLNPAKFGLFAWQLFSHKVIRYLAPLFQLGALVANVALVTTGPMWRWFLFGQVLFYTAAGIGYAFRPRKARQLFAFPYYLTLLNAASAVGWVSFLLRKKQTTWQPRT